MFDRILNFFTSLRLTVVLLLLALVLVFAGTLAQVKYGLYVVQSEYFRSLFVWWHPQGASWKVPIYPGGWLLGGFLLINLVAAHIKRFKFTWKKSGIFLTHIGLILLLAGQFLTEMFQTESQMRLEQGETKNYSDDSMHNELAVIDTTNPERDEVVAIPQSMVAEKGEIRHPSLPFILRVKSFAPNTDIVGPMVSGEKIKATKGIGMRLLFQPVALTGKMDDENKPAALIEVVTPDQGSLGEWTVSTWLTKYPWIHHVRESVGSMLGNELDAPQTFSYKGHNYEIALRPIRYYKPYSLTLLKFQHDIYKGTDIPKNFASRVHLSDPSKGEERDILIYMNNPLRYGGETYYQASFERGDTVTILQVVNNPAAATPYIACSLVGLGLVVQFLMHLVGFVTKRNKPTATMPNNNRQTRVEVAGDRSVS